jgi:predicted Fe-S protein YdhL (DUF1289 family)
MCSEGSFAQLFGIPEEKATAKAKLPRAKVTVSTGTASPVQESWMTLGALFGTPEDKALNAQQWWTRSAAKSDMTAFRPRSQREIEYVARKWALRAQPRAMDFFCDGEEMVGALRKIAEGLDKDCDPVINCKGCACWYGEFASWPIQLAKERQPVVQLAKERSRVEEKVQVQRLLAFIFSEEESFDRFVKLPKGRAIDTTCGNPHCVSLAHMSA